MAEPTVEGEYYWWDLEDTIFKGVLYDSIGLYFLKDHPYQCWGEFATADPHLAYAHLTYVRFEMLEQQFVDLRVIPQMLGVEDVPLKSSVRDINKYDWLKSIMDLALFRFASLRDIAFHFVNEVLELGIDDLRLNLKSLKKKLGDSHPGIVVALEQIDQSGAPLRTDRNERAHKGFCNLFTDDDQMFNNMSWSERHGEIHGYDLIGTYEKSRETIYDVVVSETEAILKIVVEMLDELYPCYRDRFEELSGKSKNGERFSQHFHLHRKH